MAVSGELQGAFPEDTLQVLLDSNAIIQNDHFVYISGAHGSGWIDKDAIYPHTDRVQHLCRNLGRVVRDRNIEVVCGPATGGLIIAEWTSHEIGALSTFTDHELPKAGELRGKFVLRRGYDHLVAGKRVLVVDDIVNTGYSIRQTIDAVRGARGEVVAAAALVSRGNVGAEGLGVEEYLYLLEFKIPAWPADQCPLCATSVPVNTQYAHGADFLAARSKA
ncbi:phosphoribosyltransferase family protein [soil metagenome]